MSSYWGIFWIDASSKETAAQGFINIARACGIKEDVEVSRRWLADAQEPWLLIIDNADDPSMDLTDYFPSGDRGAILITTRNPTFGIHGGEHSRKIDGMDVEEAATLLLKSAAKNLDDELSRTVAELIAERLGCLPLAIIQAGAWIRHRLYDLEEFYCAYPDHAKTLLSHPSAQGKNDHDRTVYATFEVSVDAITKTASEIETASHALEILQFYAFLHFEGISEQILRKAGKNIDWPKLPEWTQDHVLNMLRQNDNQDSDVRRVREAESLLLSYSLLEIDSEGGSRYISLHPLVHEWARNRLNETEKRKCGLVAASTLSMSISWEFEPSDYKFRRILLPHVDSCLSFCREALLAEDKEGELDRLEIVSKFALVYCENGRGDDALTLRETIRTRREALLGPDNLHTLSSMHNLANSYKDCGRWKEALPLRIAVQKSRRERLGADHHDTLSAQNNVGISYSDLSRFEDALSSHLATSERRQKLLGEKHPDTLTSLHNLADSYANCGRDKDNRDLKVKALDMAEKVVSLREAKDKDSPDTLQSKNNLASYHNMLGHYEDAIRLHTEVLKARKIRLGEEHPDTLTSMHNLACSYDDNSQGQEATELFEKVVEARRRQLGDEHPYTQRSEDKLNKAKRARDMRAPPPPSGER